MQKTRKKIVDTSTTISKGGRADAYANFHVIKKTPRKNLTNSTKQPEDVNPYEIVEKYNLKGFEFGNWLSNDERYDNLLATEESLLFLAWLFKSQNLGFNRMIGIAFGARGHRGALAHYETNFNMINLTKEKGAGSLAHEYGHAIDYNFGRYIDQHNKYSSLSGGKFQSSKPLIDNVGSSLRAMVNEIVDYPATIGRVWYGYWGERTEVFARLFEEYIAHTLKKVNQKNTYLSKSLSFYYTGEVYMEDGTTIKPYLTEAEFKPLMKKFDTLVKELGKILNSKSKIAMPLVPYPLPKAAAQKDKKEETNINELLLNITKFYDEMKLMTQYKDRIIIFTKGDIYIAIGSNAKKLSNMIDVRLYKGKKYEYVKFNKTMFTLFAYRRQPYVLVDINKTTTKPTAVQGKLFARKAKK